MAKALFSKPKQWNRFNGPKKYADISQKQGLLHYDSYSRTDGSEEDFIMQNISRRDCNHLPDTETRLVEDILLDKLSAHDEKMNEATRLYRNNAQKARTITKQSEEISTLVKEKNDQKIDISTMSSKLFMAQNAKSELSQNNKMLKDQLSSVKEEIEKLRTVNKNKDKEITKYINEKQTVLRDKQLLVQTVENRNSKISSLNEKISSLNSTCTAQESKLREKETQLRKSSGDCQRLIQEKEDQYLELKTRMFELSKHVEADANIKSRYEKEIKELENVNQYLSAELHKCESRNGFLQTNIVELNEEINRHKYDFSNQKISFKHEVEKLKQNISLKERGIALLEKEKENLGQDLQKERHRHQESILDLHKEKMTLLNNNNVLETRVIDLRKNQHNLQIALHNAKQDITNYEEELLMERKTTEEANMKYKHLHKVLSREDRNMENANWIMPYAQNNEMKGASRIVSSETAEQTTSVGIDKFNIIKSELEKLKQENAVLHNKLTDWNTATDNIQTHAKGEPSCQCNSKLAKLYLKMEELQKHNTTLQQRVITKEEEINSQNQNYKESLKKCKSIDEALKRKEVQIGSLNNTTVMLQKELELIKQQKNQVQESAKVDQKTLLDHKQMMVNALTNKVAESEKDVEDLKKEKEQLKLKVRKLENSNSQIQKDLEVKVQEMAKISHNVKLLESSHEDILSDKLKQKQSEVSMLTSKLSSMELKESRLLKERKTLKEKVEHLEVTKENLCVHLQEELDKGIKTIGIKDTEIRTLSDKVHKLEEDIQERVGGIREKELEEKKVEDLEHQNKELQQQTTELKLEQNILNEKVLQQEKEIKSCTLKAEKYKKELLDCQTTFDSQDSKETERLNQLQDSIKNLQLEVTNLRKNTSELQENCSIKQDQLEEMSIKYKSSKSDYDESQKNIETVKNKYEPLLQEKEMAVYKMRHEVVQQKQEQEKLCREITILQESSNGIVSKKNEELQSRDKLISEIKSENANLKEEITCLRKQSVESHEMVQNTASEKAILAEQLQKLKTELMEKEDMHKNLVEAAKKSHEKSMEKLQIQYDDDIKKYKLKLEQLQNENKTDDQKAKERHKREMAEKNRQLSELREQNKELQKLQAEVQEKHSAEIKNYQEQLAVMQNDNLLYKETHAKEMTEKEAIFTEKINKYTEKADTTTKEYDAEMKELRIQIELLQNELSTCNDTLTANKTHLAEKENFISILQNDLQDTKLNLDKHTSEVEGQHKLATKRLVEQVEKLKSEIKDCELQRKTLLNEHSINYETKIENIKSQHYSDFERVKDDCRIEVEKIKEVNSHTINEKEEHIDKLQNQLSEMEKQQEELLKCNKTFTINQDELAEKDHIISTQQNDLVEAKRNIKKIKDAMDEYDAKYQSDAKVLLQQVEELKLDKQKTEVAREALLKEQSDRYADRIKKLKEQHDNEMIDLQHQVSEVENHKAAYEKMVQDITWQLTEKDKLLTEKDETYNRKKGRMKLQLEQLRKLVAEKDNLLSTIEKKHKDNVQKLHSQIEQSEKHNSSEESKVDNLRKVIADKDQILTKYEKQIKKLKKENQDNGKQLMEKENEVKSMAKKNEQLQSLINEFKEKVEEQEGKHTVEVLELRNDVVILQGNLSKMRDENDGLRQKMQSTNSKELKDMNKLLSQKNKKIEELSLRLSEEMSQKISSDERSLENVSIKNRPMNIAEEYEMVCSNEWHEAKSALDELCQLASEENKIKLLCSIFQHSEQEANCHIDKLMRSFLNMLDQPFGHPSALSKSTSATLPPQLQVLIGDCLRNNAEYVNTSTIEQTVKQQSRQNLHHHIDSSLYNHEEFVGFVAASVKLAWKMVLQRPPMSFVQDGIGEKWQGESKQDVFFSSSDPHDPLSRVKYFVHPCLYHSEAMMVKGRVYLSKSVLL